MLFVVDLLYPLITRVLFQYFSCRDLGSAGSWLEADHAVDCKSKEYTGFVPIVAGFAVFWSVGVPALFLYLVHNFHHHGKAGDKVVRGSIAWMYDPFRAGKEWWLAAELIRLVLLTSAVGWMAERCWPVMILQRTFLD